MGNNHNSLPTVIEIIGMGAKKYGGFEKFIIEECRQLKSMGYHLIVCFSVEPICQDYINDLKSIGGECRVIPFKSHFRHYQAIRNLIKEYHTIAIHTNFSSCGFSTMLAAISRRVKYRIATQHCLPSLNTFKARIIYSMENLICTKYLCVSQASTDAMCNGLWWGKKKVVTEYLGVEDFFYDKCEMISKYALPADKIKIANVAYHNPVKGVDVLLKAVDILVHKKQITNFQIVQIGGGQNPEQTEALHQLEAQLHISDHIRWIGVIDTVPELLSACDIYCQPSRSEGISLSIMEASLANIPTIGTRVGGIVESVRDGETGILVDKENAQQLADALGYLINSASKRIRMGEMARKHALQKFQLRFNVTNLLHHYGINI
ncbi:glycosyltransferase [Alistipes sp. kh20]|uniref:glycosyltransferase n=1 Tax=Alistipes montrealensis TaxID=2834113 RepID=UPI001BCFD848|nr:glycosyltransferase [Alistipes montrealensis]MBS4767017.1 glycosyltransferase [Alistipes montrealensis]